ncbi:TerB family tellurite resistance protein [Alteromonas sp. A079]|uniref:tellurite resistance TerB family protein n=1 Tax=Alteromonas sp. A079 TaxID=3410268 RepID=UPI003BA03330
MFSTLIQLFEGGTTSSGQTTEHTVSLATAVLLSEVIRADAQTTDDELKAYKAQLYSQFTLSEQALSALMSEGRSTAKEATDMVQFTKVINEKCDSDAKEEIVEGLWRVALADNNIAPIEEHIIRRIADLLYVPHSVFIRAKLKVVDEKA